MNSTKRKFIEENLLGNQTPEGTAWENFLPLWKEYGTDGILGKIIEMDEIGNAITYRDFIEYFEELNAE